MRKVCVDICSNWFKLDREKLARVKTVQLGWQWSARFNSGQKAKESSSFAGGESKSQSEKRSPLKKKTDGISQRQQSEKLRCHRSNRFFAMERLIRKIEPSCHRRSRPGPVSFVRYFKHKVIKQATDDFRRILYSNAHGTAYRAVLRGGRFALVKDVRDCDQEEEVFYREVQLIGRLNHRHILLLIGFSTGRKRLLIFDSAENGSLRDHLNDPFKTPLNWRTRLQIAVGVAAALEYLLVFNDPPISHISISSSNIMLDENFNAKLSDIGILNPGNGGAGHSATLASCSKDCMGQECGNIVFQLGVLILELVTGQASENGGADLIQWIQEPRLSFSQSIDRMIDPDLGNTYNDAELKNLLAVARMCIKSANKPSFPLKQLFRYLQKKLDFPHEPAVRMD